MIHVFIVGSKGIPAQYGGFETFVENLTKGKKSSDILYHVSCMDNHENEYEYNGAACFQVKVPFPGAIGRILHVSLALRKIESQMKDFKNDTVIVYILGCRIGALLRFHASRLHKQGVMVCCNPDGLEWKRSKWSLPIKVFLKYCEKGLVQYSDLIICDSVNIQNYIQQTYKRKDEEVTYIAYGTYLEDDGDGKSALDEWYRKWGIHHNEYYLIVGRFVPENNYEVILKEFLKSNTEKDLVIVTNVEKNKFYRKLSRTTNMESDGRVKFVGTVYDQKLLTEIRKGAYAYIHGHEVGGTNPSLLEALATTKLNLLYEVGFNKEVGRDTALYWSKKDGSLSSLIEKVETLTDDVIGMFSQKSKKRVREAYNWNYIVKQYEDLWHLYGLKK